MSFSDCVPVCPDCVPDTVPSSVSRPLGRDTLDHARTLRDLENRDTLVAVRRSKGIFRPRVRNQK